MHPEAHQVRLEVAIPPHGENYSRSRGEGYARDADLAKTTPTPPAYERLVVAFVSTHSPGDVDFVTITCSTKQ